MPSSIQAKPKATRQNLLEKIASTQDVSEVDSLLGELLALEPEAFRNRLQKVVVNNNQGISLLLQLAHEVDNLSTSEHLLAVAESMKMLSARLMQILNTLK